MNATEIATKILGCFAGIYKRSGCAVTLYDEAVARASKCIASGQPVEFVKYWGKGERALPSAPENEGIIFLGNLFKRVEATWSPQNNLPPYRIQIIAADNHILNNGFGQGMDDYFGATIKAMQSNGLHVELNWLSRYYKPPHADELLNLARQQPIGDDLLEIITTRAMKHNTRLSSYTDSAQIYNFLALQERKIVSQANPNSIFLTYNGYDSLPLMPEMPTIFINSFKGKTHKPWFVDL
jgi:hypothetical protein